MVGVRGVLWKCDEILDLLAIWGEKTVHTAHKEKHKNREIFQNISKTMLELGHQRMEEECRTKTKGLHQAYMMVLTYNSKSGNSLTTCPYNDQLDCILKRDLSVKTRRLSQSLQRENAVRTEQPSSRKPTLICILSWQRREEESKKRKLAPAVGQKVSLAF